MRKTRNNRLLFYAPLAVAAILALWACAPKVKVEKVPEPAPPVVSGDELYLQGEKLFEKKAYEQALAPFNEYLARFPEGPLADAALMKMGAIYTALKNYATARSIYEHLIRRYPASRFVPAAGVEILAAYFNEGKYEAVISAFPGIDLEKLPEDQIKRTLLLTGDAHWITGFPSKAASFFARAYLVAPDEEKDTIRAKIREALRLLSPSDIATLVAGTTSPAAKSLLEEVAKPFAYHRFSLGCLLPLSGRFAGYGNRALKGVELALSRFTGGTDMPDLKIVIKDTGGDPEKAARAVRELVETDRVAAVIGSIVTAETAALASQQAGIPIITMTQKDQITHIGDFVFRNFFTPGMQVHALVSYCTKVLGLERFAILYPDEPYGIKFMNLFWDEVIAAGGKVVGVEAYDKTRTDFADPIKKLVGLYYDIPDDLKDLLDPPETEAYFSGTGFDFMLMDPVGTRMADMVENRHPAAGGDAGQPEAPQPIVDFDAVFIPDAPKKVGLIIPQLAYYDVKDTYLLGTNLWYSPSLIEMTRQYAQGAVIPVGFFPRSTSDRVKNFVQTFQDTFGEEPGFIEAVAYDTTMMLLTTIAKPGVQSRNALKDALLNFGVYEGVTGPTLFNSDGDVIRTLPLLRIKGGEFVELTFEPPNPRPESH